MIINNINKQERKESRTNIHGGLNEKKRGEIERNFSLSFSPRLARIRALHLDRPITFPIRELFLSILV